MLQARQSKLQELPHRKTPLIDILVEDSYACKVRRDQVSEKSQQIEELETAEESSEATDKQCDS